MCNRTIQNEKRARQLILFDGMNIQKRGFTDFDAVMEWRNQAWLVFEVKHGDKEVPTGQRIALERFVGDVQKAGKHAVAAIVEHYESDPNNNVYLKHCIAREIFVTGELHWRPPSKPLTARRLMLEYIDYIESAQSGRFLFREVGRELSVLHTKTQRGNGREP